MASAIDMAERVDGGASKTEHDVVMPRVAKDLERAAIVRWMVHEGQAVQEGDVIAEIAAGHTTMEVEARTDGIVEALLPAGPGLVEAGVVIARIAGQIAKGKESETAPSAQPHSARSPAPVARWTEGDALDLSSSELTYAEALRAGLAAQLRRDADVFVIGEGVADFGRCSAVMQGLAEDFGERRIVGTPITPHAVVGLAVGAALAGLKPVVEVTAWALALQALDPIVSTAAKTRYRSGGALGVPLVLRGRNGAWPGTGVMHNVNLASWFAHVPGLKVVCPATPRCAKGLMQAAILDPDPVVVLEPHALYDVAGSVPDSDDWVVPLGKARVARSGGDLSIVTYGAGVALAMAAAETLDQSGVSAEVIDLRSLRPLDMPAVLASVRKTGRLLTLDDGWPVCSIGAEICAGVAAAAFGSLKAAPVRMEGADTPVPFATNLEALVLPDAEEVAAKALRLADQGRV